MLAMKSLGEGGFFARRGSDDQDQPARRTVVPNRLSIKEALYFVWSLPVSVLITGPDDADMLREKIALARSFTNMSEEERAALIEKVADIAATGEVEDYKYG